MCQSSARRSRGSHSPQAPRAARAMSRSRSFAGREDRVRRQLQPGSFAQSKNRTRRSHYARSASGTVWDDLSVSTSARSRSLTRRRSSYRLHDQLLAPLAISTNLPAIAALLPSRVTRGGFARHVPGVPRSCVGVEAQRSPREDVRFIPRHIEQPRCASRSRRRGTPDHALGLCLGSYLLRPGPPSL